MRVFHMKELGLCKEEKILEACSRLPKGERAKEENKRLAAKWSLLMRDVMIIWAWICLRCCMVVDLSARIAKVGGF